ncbi:MAG: hypothetical protein J6V25_08380 [Oscillospiraceae bacterium]|nr:hypothetical protein [Oscillospiraceae bacterium]
MKKNTKKKVLTLALVIALLAIAVVGGSLAWFTAEDSATNTFTVGSIRIQQIEQQRDENGNLQDYVNTDKVLLPIVNINNPRVDENYQSKIVTVKNTGRNDAYVRTFIAVPQALSQDYLKLVYSEFRNDTYWKHEGTSVVDYMGESYVVYCYVYQPVLGAGESTEELLDGVYLKAEVDLKDNPETANSDNLEFCIPNGQGGYTFSDYEIVSAEGALLKDGDGNTKTVNVLVLTQAVQADGFDSANEALDAAFGVVGTLYDPFPAAE